MERSRTKSGKADRPPEGAEERSDENCAEGLDRKQE
jgi:hypothetical protein